jgi:hypothetical protein
MNARERRIVHLELQEFPGGARRVSGGRTTPGSDSPGGLKAAR